MHIKKLGNTKRRSLSVSNGDLVRLEPLYPDRSLPLLARPTFKGVDLTIWTSNTLELIQKNLSIHGAILFRNFDLTTASEFEQFIKVVSPQLLEYRERSSPRSQVLGNIYTSTNHPADQTIFLHNENSYQQSWPMKIFFFCTSPATSGGETPLADCRRVFARLNSKLVERFEKKQVMYVRNFGDGFGLPWETVYNSTDRNGVEQQCRTAGVELEWKENNRLRTRAVRPVLARHPQTRELTWFNHATFFNISTIEESTRKALLADFGPEDLPTNSFYGDGSSIEPSVLDELRDCYLQEQVSFQWERGDLLMVDNMLVAHGRAPFTGQREVLAGMAEGNSERHV